MGLWGRFMESARAFLATWNEKDFRAAQPNDWAAYKARLNRYTIFDAFYDNMAYRDITRFADRMKQDRRLYKHIRGIYNPVARYTDLMSSYVYGGMLDTREGAQGAIPLESDNPAVYEGIVTLWKASRWWEQKSRYARDAIKYGDSLLKVVDDRDSRRVRLEVIHPGRLKEARFDEVGNIIEAVIEYERTDEPSLAEYRGKRGGIHPLEQMNPQDVNTFTYTEILTKDAIITLRDGEEFGFYNDADGRPISRWVNEFGFVPLVLANDLTTNSPYGAPRFYPRMDKLHEVNDQASLLGDQIRKVVIPLLVASGVSGANQMGKAYEEKDAYTILYAPTGSELKSIVPVIDIAGSLENIREMLSELENDLPALALQHIRERGGDLTAPGIEAGYSDAIRLVEDTQSNLDGALIRAQQMALTIGGVNGYEGYQGFDLDSYDRGDTDHTIAHRPVIRDRLSVRDRVTVLKDAGAPLATIMREMGGFTEDEIAEATAAIERKELEQAAAAARGLAEAAFGDDEDEVDDGEEENDEEV